MGGKDEKIMKKLLLILSMFAVMVCFTSCENENVKRLKREIEAADKQCPVNMGMIGDMLSMKYDEKAKEVQLYFSLHDDMLSIEALKNNEQMALQSMKLSFSKGESREMLKQMIKAGAGLSITYKSASTGKSFKVNLSLDDLKEIRDTPMTDEEINKMLLENQLAIENSRCPYLVDEGMEMVKAYDDGANIVYACRIDEDMYDISALKYAQDEIKQNMKEIFKDPLMKKQLGIIKSLDKGFVYHYYGDTSGESVDIIFSNDELSRYLR